LFGKETHVHPSVSLLATRKLRAHVWPLHKLQNTSDSRTTVAMAGQHYIKSAKATHEIAVLESTRALWKGVKRTLYSSQSQFRKMLCARSFQKVRKN
jgi:hypothetical protein